MIGTKLWASLQTQEKLKIFEDLFSIDLLIGENLALNSRI